MVKINSENIIISLMELGFDSVDIYLYTFVLRKLLHDNKKIQLFEFVDEPKTHLFNEVIVNDECGYHFKKGISLSSKFCKNDNVTLRTLLKSKSELIDYLVCIDFKEIVLDKLSQFNSGDINSINTYFCDKEKDIIINMFNPTKEKEYHDDIFDEPQENNLKKELKQ